MNCFGKKISMERFAELSALSHASSLSAVRRAAHLCAKTKCVAGFLLVKSGYFFSRHATSFSAQSAQKQAILAAAKCAAPRWPAASPRRRRAAGRERGGRAGAARPAARRERGGPCPPPPPRRAPRARAELRSQRARALFELKGADVKGRSSGRVTRARSSTKELVDATSRVRSYAFSCRTPRRKKGSDLLSFLTHRS